MKKARNEREAERMKRNRARDREEIIKLKAFYEYLKKNYPAIVTKYEAQRELNGSAPAALVRPLLPWDGDADLEDHPIMAEAQLHLLKDVEALFHGELFEDFNFEEVLN